MSDQDDAQQPQLTEPSRWARTRQWIRREGRFVADTVHPDSSNLTRGRRIAAWGVLHVKGLTLFLLGALAAVITAHCTAEDSARTSDHAEDTINAEKGYIHASIRRKPDSSYEMPFATYFPQKLTPRQLSRFKSGEFDSGLAVQGGTSVAQWWRGWDYGSGQVYFVDLVSDSSSMITVTGMTATDITCRKSKMLATVDTPSPGDNLIKAVAFKLQGQKGPVNALIDDYEDPNWGKLFFDHHTITLGGGADAQTLSVLGVAEPGSSCAWNIEASFTTDDGQQHRARITSEPLVSEGGPGKGVGQYIEIDPSKVVRWKCDHGDLKDPQLCKKSS
ncbi:hypothetical protein KBP30_35750 [Streptomyces sp. Go40/10]|uniref:hypothetical protein n=1 Tax=Streptomyces sp. Go40/10 TaxID=2825844 RepID=UPI001E358565|nr:hypothetical protein [Streptomyces sp. Go40/10]UFR06201.1 hypothetical protein KBP30_35750 [Streptomyces sp. Go40/10]